MRTRARIRTHLAGALGVLLGALLPAAVPAAAGAQTDGLAGRLAAARWDRPWDGAGPALEAFYTRLQTRGDLPGTPGGRALRASGLGGRLMWPLAAAEAAREAAGDPARPASWLARRTSVGLFGAYTQEPNRTFTAAQLGVAADLAPVGAPIAGRVEPFLSLGAGALHTASRVDAVARPRPADHLPRLAASAAPAPAPTRARSATSLLLVPGVGARVRVRPGVAAQGDVRQLVTVRGHARRAHPAVGVGLRLAI